ncbi:hypothetical protein [Pilibacter termitis]|nr:hypothetical protein [Pilibacter termitis]
MTKYKKKDIIKVKKMEKVLMGTLINTLFIVVATAFVNTFYFNKKFEVFKVDVEKQKKGIVYLL